MSYTRHATWGRLYSAVEALATGSGDIRDRLRGASVLLSDLKAEEFPEELRDKIPFVYRLGDESATMQSLSSLTDEDACKLADEILHVYDVVAREYCTAE